MNHLMPQHHSAPNIDADTHSYLRQWGTQSLAYSALQPGLECHEWPGVGMVPYRRMMGHTLALGNPLCAPSDRKRLLQQFLAHHPRSLFGQVDGATVDTLRDLGLYCTPMGMDAFIDIPHFTLTGKSKRDLRHYTNRCAAVEVGIREVNDTPAERFEIQQLSHRWMRTKKVSSRELSFLVRPLSPQPEPDTRLFIAQQGSQTIGFVLFDPLYNKGRITGYTASIFRALPEAPEGCLDTITLHAIEVFKQESIDTLSLGVMPMHRMKETADQYGSGATLLYQTCRALYASPWQPLSNLRGLSFHKSRYRPREVPVFVATTSPVGLHAMTALTRVCGLLPF